MVRASGDIHEDWEEPSVDLTGGSPNPTTLNDGWMGCMDLDRVIHIYTR